MKEQEERHRQQEEEAKTKAEFEQKMNIGQGQVMGQGEGQPTGLLQELISAPDERVMKEEAMDTREMMQAEPPVQQMQVL